MGASSRAYSCALVAVGGVTSDDLLVSNSISRRIKVITSSICCLCTSTMSLLLFSLLSLSLAWVLPCATLVGAVVGPFADACGPTDSALWVPRCAWIFVVTSGRSGRVGFWSMLCISLAAMLSERSRPMAFATPPKSTMLSRLLLDFFLPSSFFISLTRSAYLSVLRVCSHELEQGDTFAIMTVRARLPTKESRRTDVSLDPRNGTCPASISKARMHSFSASRLLLISAPSRRVCLSFS
mmetsp:Transcript_2395/g.7444  ORF Transcript_2395/g.7444 Transcript_2395/m.7444 type:complete len:239 (+) Transcript_2395:651-1367(+)